MANRNREYIDFLKQRFDETKFIEFISDLLNLSSDNINTSMIELKPEQKQFKDTVEYYKFVANYKSNSDGIGTFIVKLSSEGSQNARASQRTFISTLLNKYELDAALVAFYQDDEPSWRLSFVKKELNFTDKGIKVDLTPAKRYSYLVGENESVHTAQEYLFSLLNIEDRKITLADIEKVFDVEKVTKKFFEEYKEKYLQLKEFLDENEDFLTESRNCDFTSEEFAKKLMGQIVFLYFLQKKGWLGVQIVPDVLSKDEYYEISSKTDSVCNNLLEKYYIYDNNEYRIDKQTIRNESIKDNIDNFISIFKGTKYDKPWGSGDKQFVRNMFKKSKLDHKDNFFDEYLEPFFYTGLNEKRNNQYFVLFNCKIPFLNGGLFEPLNNYRWSSAQFNIPDSMFSNDKREGILDIFDLYNFTIDEEEPLEKDIAVDPEMLGKIFENLLDVKNRKSTGSFYTPREIVHYMCQESLANYLVNKLGIPYEDIITFIKYGDVITQTDWNSIYNKDGTRLLPESIWNKIIKIDQALIDIKIADPAVGSGAFPLGMLNEIVKLRDNISSYLLIQKDLNVINENDFSTDNRDTYSMKLQTIQNSIYAVDIEISAVDIAKLRLWLSLIVDYPNEQEPRPLPNLDCKIMQGNSLLDEYEGISLFNSKILDNHLKNYKRNSDEKSTKSLNIQFNLFDKNSDLDSQMKQLIKYQEEYFITQNSQRKKELKHLIEDIQFGMISLSIGYDTKKLREIEELSKKKSKNWFIWKLEFFDVFKNNGGFDIVIGNPPYVGEKGNKNIFDPINKSSFGKQFHIGRMDLFYYFFHKSIDIGKDNALISFITTNYYVTADGGSKLRRDFYERTHIDKLINFNELSIFETAKGQHNMITFLRKSNDRGETLVYNAKKNQLTDKENIYNILNLNNSSFIKIEKKNLYDSDQYYIRIYVENAETLNLQNSILNKIKSNSRQLIELCNVNQGARTGVDKITDKHIMKFGNEFAKGEGVFVLSPEEVAIKGLNNCSSIKPWYKNSDISRYYTNDKNSYYVIYSQNNDLLSEDNKPAYEHLKKYKRILEARDSEYSWYKMDRPRKEEIFISEKIVSPQRSPKNTFAYNTGDWFASADVYFITKKLDVDLKYILGILNSKLYYYWLYCSGKRKGEMLELYQTPLSKIPIKNISVDNQRIISQYVDEIINIKKANKNANINEIQNKLDSFIYKIYQLNNTEIAQVESLYNN